MTDTCPPGAQLERLLADGLSAAEEQALEAHLAGCAACQGRLEQLTACGLTLPPAGPAPQRVAAGTPRPAGVLGRVADILPNQARRREPGPEGPRPHAGTSPPPALPAAPPDPARGAPGTVRQAKRTFVGSASLRANGNFLRRQFWVWPLVAAAVLGAAGWWVNRSVEGAMRQQRINELTTVLEADVAALRVWMNNQRALAEVIAGDDRLLPPVTELLALADGKPEGERRLVGAKAQAAVRSRLAGPLKRGGFAGFVLLSPAGVTLAADGDAPVGKVLIGYRKEFMERVLRGQAAVSRPFLSPPLADDNGELQAPVPVMLAAAPVRDEAGKPVAALALCVRPEDEFTRILRAARPGESGETYAFDRRGLLLSQSRFDEDLKRIGLLVDQPGSRSILTLELRDPGVNLVEGERPGGRRADRPLTRMAAEAVQGKSGHDADGYRDYRGVPVVGAWRWLDEYDLGVAAEMDLAEALRPLGALRRAFWVLMGLLILSAAAVFAATLLIARQRRALRRAVLAARQLGQYTLLEPIGTGGMGVVYKARHALLRRPTAVKLLSVDQMSDRAVSRFEREVQLTAGLTHPNTVAVFDYGRTPEGIFYYAMEYLDGVNLDDLVARCGPLPEARLLHLLRQVCGSLAEAHAAGLVHRDVKPANILLTCRGGLHDFVKVLDFGLAKALGAEAVNVTSPQTVTGTPLYLSPEAVTQPERIDARADVYAIGAVGYFLLTGSPVFTGGAAMEICLKHVHAAPEPPSARCGRPVSPALEALLLRCLAKSAADRPADAGELLRLVEGCAVSGLWTAADAASWWAAHGKAVRPGAGAAEAGSEVDRPTVLAAAVHRSD